MKITTPFETLAPSLHAADFRLQQPLSLTEVEMKTSLFYRFVNSPIMLASAIGLLTMVAPIFETRADETSVKSPSLDLLAARWNFVIHIKAQMDGEALNLGPTDIDIKEGGGSSAHTCYNDPSLDNTNPDKCDHLKVNNPILVEVWVTRRNPTCVTVNWGGTWQTICRP